MSRCPDLAVGLKRDPQCLSPQASLVLIYHPTAGLVSNPKEGMDVCKYIVLSRNGSTLNSHRAVRPLVRSVEVEERWDAPVLLQGVLPQNWGGTEQNRTVTSMVLKAKANDRH
ncbi:uncharacterized protein TNCV_3121861 [Trichonephila clavipes]|nr:uncharacterized protein TNCV_3121861 [Trichonephila clavipes]